MVTLINCKPLNPKPMIRLLTAVPFSGLGISNVLYVSRQRNKKTKQQGPKTEWICCCF